MDAFAAHYSLKGFPASAEAPGTHPDLIVGIESRGFVVGSAFAAKTGLGFVPIRKRGKLPAEVHSHEYDLEYGSDCVEIEEEKAKRKQAEERAKAALASLEEMGKVKEEARGTVITLDGSVLFASGKYDLLPIARQKLTDIAHALRDQGYKKMTVEGHTDSRGSESTNRSLSENRAMSVRTLLVSEGIEPDKISSVGLGESRPIADNNSAEGRANNRRVEIIVVPE
jgi:outer membrane protein OmpA-like peptidoglycan-associated protein